MKLDRAALRRHATAGGDLLRRHGRQLLPPVAALLLGALAWLLIGNGPDLAAARQDGMAGWTLPAATGPDLAAAQAAWQTRPPWGTTAAETAAAEAAEAAARPVPVGVVVEDDGLAALFVTAGGNPQRLHEGDPLPGGGQVTAIARNRVGWTDADGNARQRELFVDPLTPSADGSRPSP